ncbi:hypothetical protein HZH68_005501 [Vespula germanica]|uniref:Uncharacterized protein n=1 Tax=Vespula germanica TaxID=30212 RepID=A0A834KGD7_VESGE|nr:hypothetical protein HZH68_005501 [Vespula germanica]
MALLFSRRTGDPSKRFVVLVMPPLGTDEMGSFHITHIMYPSAYPTQLSALERKPVIIITLPRIAILCFISVALRMW